MNRFFKSKKLFFSCALCALANALAKLLYRAAFKVVGDTYFRLCPILPY